ncbi:release factor glutamine methyltransferase [Rhodococcoides kyotonense]|uniref:peptide chain release factor N(5)-glutamine methyltransferase n=2 Tax=Rhodococcoides kyotonense TaxID=398843 RepID=A0A239N400_9NOCA|nr:release factor glutamine methyltransferase [Rhodococcus kyotonensis]
MVCRRAEGTPLEQILGWAEFRGLRVVVEPGVFVPRRRTELLVDQALALGPSTVVDMCCGSGAVAAALAHSVPNLDVHATDIDPVAVQCARRNVDAGHVYEGDLYSPLPQRLRSRVDVIVANAPYVPTDHIASMPTEARDHEPRVALDGGVDGLDLHRRIADDASHWLTDTGHLLIETSEHQAERTRAIIEKAGFDARVIHSEELDATVALGKVLPTENTTTWGNTGADR